MVAVTTTSIAGAAGFVAFHIWMSRVGVVRSVVTPAHTRSQSIIKGVLFWYYCNQLPFITTSCTLWYYNNVRCHNRVLAEEKEDANQYANPFVSRQFLKLNSGRIRIRVTFG